MVKYLYLMRHGETLFNVQHKIQGWCDSPLTSKGIAQAKVAGKYFKEQQIEFDYGYCSTSERASDTLEIVTEGKLPYQREKGLKEWNFGAFEGKDECLNPKLPYRDFFVQYGGEDQEEVKQRLGKTLTRIMQNETHTTILAVSHGGACANFLRYCLKTDELKPYIGGKIGNCAIFKFSFEDGQFSFEKVINLDFSKLP